MVIELADNLGPLGAFVHHADEGGAQLHIGNVLHHVATHAAVDYHHITGVSPVGNIHILREALYIHKNIACNNYTHDMNLSFCIFI